MQRIRDDQRLQFRGFKVNWHEAHFRSLSFFDRKRAKPMAHKSKGENDSRRKRIVSALPRGHSVFKRMHFSFDFVG